MMFHYFGSKPHPSERQQIANSWRSLGWVGFWIQLILTIVSALILALAMLDPNLNLNLKSGIGLLCEIGSINA